jgi:hypothetical protein
MGGGERDEGKDEKRKILGHTEKYSPEHRIQRLLLRKSSGSIRWPTRVLYPPQCVVRSKYFHYHP